jgi:hypothetical protein
MNIKWDTQSVYAQTLFGSSQPTEAKWTIYNNTKQWQNLSDEQKGALLLHIHKSSDGKCCIKYHSIDYDVWREALHPKCIDNRAYRAIKPQPEMWEVMRDDWLGHCNTEDSSFKAMVKIGWTKK